MPFGQTTGSIKPQERHRCPALWRAGHNPRAIQLKMVSPDIAARMVERYDPIRDDIERRHVGAFSPVANDAGVGQVVEQRTAAMLEGDNVVDLVGREGQGVGDKAIFTALTGSLSHQTMDIGRQRATHGSSATPSPSPFAPDAPGTRSAPTPVHRRPTDRRRDCDPDSR